MARKITPQMVFAFVKVTVALCFIWPLPKTASRFQVIRCKILRFLLCMNAIVIIMSVIYTLYHNDYDLSIVTKLWCFLSASVQIPVQITELALQHNRLQVRKAKMRNHIILILNKFLNLNLIYRLNRFNLNLIYRHY